MQKPSFLDITVFLSGASVMVVELLATRLLAPYLGYTLFSWTAVIAVVLAALSIGYHVGGKLADERKELSRILFGVIFLAGMFVMFIPMLSLMFLPISTLIGIKYGPLFASLALFALPAALFGMVIPLATRIRTLNLSSLGQSVGDLYAISTAGSIFGTLLTGYILISSFGIKTTFLLTGTVLVLLAAAGLFAFSGLGRKKNEGRRVWLLSAVALVLLSAAASFAVPSITLIDGQIRYEKDSNYYKIMVLDLVDRRILRLDSDAHSGILLDTGEPAFKYIQTARDVIAERRPDSILALGLGGGTIPTIFADSSTVDAVEIDPDVVIAARDYFGLSDRVNAINDDARVLISELIAVGKRYDVIFMDAYNSHFSIAPHLATKETVTDIRRLLAEDGIVVINVISAREGMKSGMYSSLAKTYAEEFPFLYVLQTNNDSEHVQNMIIIASPSELPGYNGNRISEEELNGGIGMVLTDDYAPVENIMAESFD